MPRAADYTIQGFLYQFNKTALEILKAQDDDKITLEGFIEDIEVATTRSLTAVQCKYHEASTSFTASAIYKPLIQMLKHFSENQTANIKYVLFAHFPGVGKPFPEIDKKILKEALESKNKGLASYIEAIASDINLDGFLSKFTMEFGACYDDIAKQVGKELEANGIPNGEIETLAYPNTIQMVAKLSAKHNPGERQVSKKNFLSELKAIRKTAISRWTLALKSRDKLLQARRKQLKVHLDKNARLRYFVINPRGIEDYDNQIVLFISDYIDKYHFKAAHISTPILCLCANQQEIQDIQQRLFAKGIVSNDGYVGGVFEETHFFRDPLSSKNEGGRMKREFHLRILACDDQGKILKKRKCDDLFLIGADCNTLDTKDVNVEKLVDVTLREVKYIMGVSDVYE